MKLDQSFIGKPLQIHCRDYSIGISPPILVARDG
jgi:hypothetical protein